MVSLTMRDIKIYSNPETIREVISKLGYDADNVKADNDAYNKLDGCCKKSE